MFSTMLSLSPIASGLLALALAAATIVCLIKDRPFLVVFTLLLFCRLVIAKEFLLLASAQGCLAIVLGALKDFVFVVPVLLLPRTRRFKIIAICIIAPLLTLNLMDVGYLLETFFRLQKVLFENVNPASLLIRKDMLLVFCLLVLVPLALGWFLFFRLAQHPTRRRTAFAILCPGLAALVFGLYPAYPKTGDYLTDEINMERNSSLQIVAESSVRNFLEEIILFPDDTTVQAYEYSPEELNFLKSSGVLDKKQRSPFRKPAYDRVIYVFIESLSLDLLNCKVSEPGGCVMPFYSSLLADSKNIALNNYYSSAFTTDEGIYAAFASRPDFANDDLNQRDLQNIFSLARQKGYISAYFMGASVYFRSKFKTYINTMQVDEIYGKEQTMDLPELNTGFEWGDTDERIFEKALLWIKQNRKKKFISIICTINTHPPFYSQGKIPPGVEDTPITRAFHATDLALQDFYKQLEKNGLLDKRTLLIIGADHQITHGGELALDHLPQNKFGNRRIPLVMVAKDKKPLQGLLKDARASAIDMAPTLGDLLALPEQKSYYGKSLFLKDKRYDLAMTRGGLFFFGTDEGEMSFDLRYRPDSNNELALYKWYFNIRDVQPPKLKESKPAVK